MRGDIILLMAALELRLIFSLPLQHQNIPELVHEPELNNENSLLTKVSLGDRAAYTLLYLHYYPRLYRFVFFASKSHEDSEEMIQNCFYRVWERRASLIGIRSFEGYLFRMAKNELFDTARKSKLRDKVLRIVTESKPLEDNVVEKQISYNNYYEAANEAINLLPPRKRNIFLLSSQEDLSLDEIAERMDISRSLVKKELYSSVKFIKYYLEKNAGWGAVLLLFHLF